MATTPHRAPSWVTALSESAAAKLAAGAVGGFAAGVVFMVLDSWFSGTLGQPALAPFRAVATLAQGPPPAAASIWIGMAIHSALSVVLGLIFAAIVMSGRVRDAREVVLAGLIYGGVVYAINFQVLARFVGQFSAFQRSNQPFELAIHLVFGAVLALFMLPLFSGTGASGKK